MEKGHIPCDSQKCMIKNLFLLDDEMSEAEKLEELKCCQLLGYAAT